MTHETVTSKEMKEIEKIAAESGMPYIEMMENAGKAAADEIIKNYKISGKIIAVIAGKGNNGGDGYVAARYLQHAGALVMVIMIDGFPTTIDAQTNFDRCRNAGIEILQYEYGASDILLGGADYIIDSVYGSGFHGEFKGNMPSAAIAVNNSDAKVIALDLPSGLNADTGDSALNTISADLTIAFARLKKAHISPNGMRFCGKTVLADIGI